MSHCILQTDWMWILCSTYGSPTWVFSYFTNIVKMKVNLTRKIQLETYANQDEICMRFIQLVKGMISFVKLSLNIRYYSCCTGDEQTSSWKTSWYLWAWRSVDGIEGNNSQRRPTLPAGKKCNEISCHVVLI